MAHAPNIAEAIDFLQRYKKLVAEKYPSRAATWPCQPASSVRLGEHQGHRMLIIEEGPSIYNGIGEVPIESANGIVLNRITVTAVRETLMERYGVKPRGALVLIGPEVDIDHEAKDLFSRHERALGLVAERVFLSHKGADKPRVRRFYRALKTLGFQPWLDEEDMPAGTLLLRALRDGMQSSCAAVFFITHSFTDEKYLAGEIDHAAQRAIDDADAFRLVTLAFTGEGGTVPTVPDLLRRHVYKEIDNDLDGLTEILRALPIRVGPVGPRSA